MKYVIEKRIPFGFKGEWGKLYKKYDFSESVHDVVQYQDAAYADIGQDVQFKREEQNVDKQVFPAQAAENLVSKGEYRIVQTTDAYFDEKTCTFMCIADIGDIVFLCGEYWIVDSVNEQSIYSPAPQTFYFVALKRVAGDILHGGNDD